MTLLPNRISAPMTPQRELELARGLLGVQSDAELDHFLPLLAAAAPLIGQIAGPLLKNLAGSLFGGGGGRELHPRDEQEEFLGNIIKGLVGETQAQSYEEEQFLGCLLKGVLGGETEVGEMESEAETFEREQLLGGLLSKVFGGEMEAPSYEQEQLLGGLLKGVLGGETEVEAQREFGPERMMRRARRFVRLVHMAAQHAAAEIAAMQRAGHHPDEMELRRIVLAAIVNATRRLKPRLAGAAFGGDQMQAPPQPTNGQGSFGMPPAPHQGTTVLESMISEAPPLTGGPFGGGGGGGFGNGARTGQATWVRDGNRLTITL